MWIAVAGATGFLGRPLVEHCLGTGHAVTVLTRHPRGRTDVTEVEWHPDGHAGSWASAIDGAEAVVNLVGESLAGGRWTPARKMALHESRVLPTRSLVAALERADRRPPLLLNASAVGYYGPRGDEPVTEGDGPGHDFLGRLAVDWEAAALAAESGGTRVVLLRTGLPLAPDGGLLGSMLLPFQAGVGGPLGSGRQFLPWIHRGDWVGLVAYLLELDGASGPINVTAPTPVTNEQFSRTLARVLRRPCLFRVPAFALRLALGELSEALLTGQRAIPSRAQQLGYRFRFPELEGALRDLLGR